MSKATTVSVREEAGVEFSITVDFLLMSTGSPCKSNETVGGCSLDLHGNEVIVIRGVKREETRIALLFLQQLAS